MYDLIVIGAGPGGYEAAAHAARLGRKVALIERERLGGTCLNVGCIPAKTFLRSSKLFHECAEAASFGIRIGSLAFDMPAVVERKNRIVNTLVRGVQSTLRRAGVDMIAGTARIVSRMAVAVDGQVLETRNILIATGSRVAVPPIPGIHSEAVLDSNSVFGLTHVPERVAIIGGGYIGLEFACFFSEIGAQVTVYEMLPTIAAGADPEISDYLQRALESRGVRFKLGTRIAKVDTEIADCFLNATGREPVVDDLGLEALGLDFDRRGIRTSDQGRTNIPGVWVCGDVTGRRMLAHAAVREGIVAVNNMFGTKDRVRYRSIPAVIYTHPEVASVGWTEAELASEGRPYRKSVVPMSVSGRFLIENAQGSGLVKILTGVRYGEILGVHAVGDASSEFIVAAAAMVDRETSASDAARVVFPHPTVSEALREAILAAVH